MDAEGTYGGDCGERRAEDRDPNLLAVALMTNVGNMRSAPEIGRETSVDRGVAAKRAPVHVNGFGALRLIFASMVIISHSVEMLDGNQSREPLHALFGNVSFGGLAVTGFFLISGYLIPASYCRGPSNYLWKRILRICPAYLLCCLLCVFVAAPLAGARLDLLGSWDWVRLGYRTVMLKTPDVGGVFAGMPYPTLNGSMWTISYEFRCYLLVAIFGVLGFYRRPKAFVAMTAGVCALYLCFAIPEVRAVSARTPGWIQAIAGDPEQVLRLLAAFMCGTCFWLLKPRLNGGVATVSFLLMLLAFFVPRLADIAMVTVGAYAMFWVALRCPATWLRRLNAKDDVSYGVYLYAWPIGALTIWFWPSISPILLMALTFVLALGCGWLSWRFIEKPCLALKSARFSFVPIGRERGAPRPTP